MHRGPTVTGVLLLVAAFPFVARGQTQVPPGAAERLEGGVLNRPSQEREPLPEYREPPAPVLPPVPTPSEEEARKPGTLRVFVKAFNITGNTVFSDAELAEITQPYTNRTITYEDLEAVRYALTAHYVQHGYVNSGAVIPDQTVQDGVIIIQIVEGKLNAVDIKNNRWFRAGYLRRRLMLYAGPPLNMQQLELGLQLLQQNPLIKRVNAELRPGIERGEAILDTRIEEDVPYKLGVELNNYQSPSVGSERGVITGADYNLTGMNDALSVRYGITSGVDDIDTTYVVPISARDTTVGLEFRRSDASVVEGAAFRRLDITSSTDTYGLTVRHPFYRTLGNEIAASLGFENRRSQTFISGRPFPFAAGTDNGESVVSAVRVTPEWIHRTPTQVLALRSRFSFGVDAIGATSNSGPLPSGRFTAWLGQFQWARRIEPWAVETLVRADIQLTPDRLLSLEQFAVGGAQSVRGYRETLLVRDNGAVGSLEVRLPIVRSKQGLDLLQVAPFFDAGTAWAAHGPTPEPRYLASVGLGLRCAVTTDLMAEVYWGYKLRDVSTPGGDPQDEGIHFRVGAQFTLPERFADWLPPWRETTVSKTF